MVSFAFKNRKIALCWQIASGLCGALEVLASCFGKKVRKILGLKMIVMYRYSLLIVTRFSGASAQSITRNKFVKNLKK